MAIAVAHCNLGAVWHPLTSGTLCNSPGRRFFESRSDPTARSVWHDQCARLGMTLLSYDGAAATNDAALILRHNSEGSQSAVENQPQHEFWSRTVLFTGPSPGLIAQ